MIIGNTIALIGRISMRIVSSTIARWFRTLIMLTGGRKFVWTEQLAIGAAAHAAGSMKPRNQAAIMAMRCVFL